MYVCICNAITEKDLTDSPDLKERLGTVCGQCLDNEDRIKKTEGQKENSYSWTYSSP